MRQVFADSGFWIGLRNREDKFHNRSRQLVQWVAQHKCVLVVTPFIFAESQAFFSRAPELRRMVMRDFWENPIVRIEQPTYEHQKQALEILRQHHDKAYSFADAVSFVVMMRLKLPDVISFDRHFHQFGQFNVIDGSTL